MNDFFFILLTIIGFLLLCTVAYFVLVSLYYIVLFVVIWLFRIVMYPVHLLKKLKLLIVPGKIELEYRKNSRYLSKNSDIVTAISKIQYNDFSLAFKEMLYARSCDTFPKSFVEAFAIFVIKKESLLNEDKTREVIEVLNRRAQIDRGFERIYSDIEIIARNPFKRIEPLVRSLKEKVESNLNIVAEVDLDVLTGAEFESYVAKLFSERGYVVKQVGGANDFGVDLICISGGDKIAIQCKRWKNSNVSSDAVQKLAGAMAIDGFNKGIVIASSDFTNSARKRFKQASQKFQIELWNRTRLNKELVRTCKRSTEVRCSAKKAIRYCGTNLWNQNLGNNLASRKTKLEKWYTVLSKFNTVVQIQIERPSKPHKNVWRKNYRRRYWA